MEKYWEKTFALLEQILEKQNKLEKKINENTKLIGSLIKQTESGIKRKRKQEHNAELEVSHNHIKKKQKSKNDLKIIPMTNVEFVKSQEIEEGKDNILKKKNPLTIDLTLEEDEKLIEEFFSNFSFEEKSTENKAQSSKKLKQAHLNKCCEVVRGKRKREKMVGLECIECKKFFQEFKGISQNKELIGKCSRHRYEQNNIPDEGNKTPEGYWDMGFLFTPKK